MTVVGLACQRCDGLGLDPSLILGGTLVCALCGGSGVQKRGVVLVDLDSTLADTSHRRHLVPESGDHGVEAWVAYSMQCLDDTPILGVVAALRLFEASGLTIHIVSGRASAARGLTVRWLAAHNVPWSFLSLRTPDVSCSNGEFKERYTRTLLDAGVRVELWLEDLPSVVERLEKLDVPVLCVNPRYEH